MKKIYQSLKECPMAEVFERQDTHTLSDAALAQSEHNVSKSPSRIEPRETAKEETPTFAPNGKIRLGP